MFLITLMKELGQGLSECLKNYVTIKKSFSLITIQRKSYINPSENPYLDEWYLKKKPHMISFFKLFKWWKLVPSRWFSKTF